MLLNASKNDLLKLLKNFYEITEIQIGVFDDEFNPITAYPETAAPFCLAIRDHPILKEKCRNCDMSGFEICSVTKKPYIYKCHMGLTEAVAPIVYNDFILGYLIFGQTTDIVNRSRVLERTKEVANEFSLDEEVLTEKLSLIKPRKLSYLKAISSLLEMCANYICVNNLLSVTDNALAYNISRFVQNNLTENLTTEFICKKFNCSKSTLYSICKSSFNCGISEYIKICRISKAKEILKAEDSPIIQISAKVGIDDTNYFIRVFKKQTGLTPKQYRVMSRQGKELH